MERKLLGLILADLWLTALLAAMLRLGTGVLTAIDASPLAQVGENWIYSLQGDFHWFWYPFVPVAVAAVKYHLPGWAPAALLLLPLPLAFCAGLLLHSALAGALAASFCAGFGALVVSTGTLPYAQYAEQLLICAPLLALACLLRLNFSSYRLRSSLIGLALAAAVYAKGVTAPLVPAALVYEAWTQKRRSLRDHWPALAVILTALLAWTAVNLACNGRFTLLEGAERAGCNISTGAAGVVATIEGDWRGLMGIPEGSSVTWWAVREVAAHPLRFALAVPKRAWYLLFTAPLLPGLPFLALAGALAALRLRRLRAAYPLMAAAAVLAGVYLLMPIEGRYFVPVWLICCTLAGLALADLAAAPRAPGGPAEANAAALLAAASAPVAAVWLAGFMLLVVFPARSASRRDLAALAAGSSSAALHEAAAAAAARAGDPAAAEEHYATALRLDDTPKRRTDLLRARFLTGDISGDELSAGISGLLSYDIGALAALRYAEEGKKEKAAGALSCSLQLCIRYAGGMRQVSGPGERALLSALRAEGAARCLAGLSALTGRLPEPRRSALLARLRSDVPALLEPASLLAAYEAGNKDDYSCSADGGSCVPNEAWNGPAVCRALLPPARR